MNHYIKKFQICAFVSTLLMLLLCFSCSAFASEDGFAEKLELIRDLKIFSHLPNDFSKEIQRCDFAEYLPQLGATSPEKVADKNNDFPYTDIKATDSCFLNICAAYNLGYLRHGESLFRPNEPVTVGEATVMIALLLGYGKTLDDSRILSSARNDGLLKNIDLKMDAPLTGEAMVNLFYNALFTETVGIAEISNTNISYKKGSTLLEEAFEIYSENAVVETNPITSIYSKAGSTLGYMYIGNISYRAEQRFYSYIGMRTECFYKVEDGERRLLHLRLINKKSVWETDCASIVSLDKNSFKYENKSGGTSKKIIENSASFLFNGKLRKFAEIDTNSLKCGNITLIDNDNDSRAEVVSIISYRNVTVSGVNIAERTVMGENGVSFDLDTDDSKRIVSIYMDGEASVIEAIKQGDIISIAESESIGTVSIIAQVCRNTVTGSITSLGTETAEIDGVSYEYPEGEIALTLNSYGVFRLSFDGRIAAAELSNYVVYGFLYRVAREGIGKIFAKIFTDKGRWVIVECADMITYNGTRMKNDGLLVAEELNDGESFKPQLVAYRVNGEKQLVTMNTAKQTVCWSEGENDAASQARFRLSAVKASSTFYSVLNAFDMEFTLNNDCYVFVIPGAFGDEEIDESKIKLLDKNCFVSELKYYNLYFYDMSLKREVPVLVVYDSIERAVSGDRLCPVTGICFSTDKDGCYRRNLKLMYGDGYVVSFPVGDEAEDIGKTIREGDIIRYVMDSDGYIVKITLVYRHGDRSYEDIITNAAYHKQTLASGVTEYVDLEKNRIVVSCGEKHVVYDLSAIESVYSYDLSHHMTEKSSKAELMPKQRVFMRVLYGKVRDIILYK